MNIDLDKQLLINSAEDIKPLKNMILFFDTETTGLPKNYKGSIFDLDNWPRVFQFAYLLCDEDGKEISRLKSFVKPDGWEVPKDKFWSDNGYTTQDCIDKGVAMNSLLDNFIESLNNSDALVAHNMSFDYPIVAAEMIRYGKRGKKVNKICTKELSTDFCQLQGNYGKFKWPTLTELHNKLFGKDFDSAHDAMADVIALKDCFFQLVKLGVIKI